MKVGCFIVHFMKEDANLLNNLEFKLGYMGTTFLQFGILMQKQKN